MVRALRISRIGEERSKGGHISIRDHETYIEVLPFARYTGVVMRVYHRNEIMGLCLAAANDDAYGHETPYLCTNSDLLKFLDLEFFEIAD
jgi:hypothetical protein